MPRQAWVSASPPGQRPGRGKPRLPGRPGPSLWTTRHFWGCDGCRRGGSRRSRRRGGVSSVLTAGCWAPCRPTEKVLLLNEHRCNNSVVFHI